MATRFRKLTHWLALEHLESREVPTVVTFQQGVGGYTGNQDTVVFNKTPTTGYGFDTVLNIDQQDLGGVRQGLIRFDGIIGPNPGQVPLGSKITAATLSYNPSNESNSSMVLSFYRMLTDWNQATASWNSFGSIGGIQASQGEAEAVADAIDLDPEDAPLSTTHTIDVSKSVQAWALGTPNFGWFVDSGSTNGIDIDSAESGNPPILSITYDAPAGAGQFIVRDTKVNVTEGDAVSKVVQIPVARVSGTSGPATVDYTITAGGGTATAGTDFAEVLTGQLSFDGTSTDVIDFIPITIFGDTALEGPETFTVTLTAASGAALGSQVTTTVTIGDDDLLINEILANSGDTANELGFEYIELLGTPNATIPANNYFVVFEGEEEEAASTPVVIAAKNGMGRADIVIDLAGQQFGSKGILVITPTNWKYALPAGANQLKSSQLDGTGGQGGLEDSSQTYAIIKSPAPIVVGTDYDTTAYTSSSSGETGPGVGVFDALPVGALIVDSVGTVEGGSGDRDRVLFTEAPGVRVHQPEGFGSTGGASNDGMSRRDGSRDPNSIGSWFNGEVLSMATPTYSLAPNANAINPVGAAMTPGNRNVLPVINFAVSKVTVNESAGSVSLTVFRSGITDVEATIGFKTIGGTAKPGLDYTDVSGTKTFAIGDTEETITIALNNESLPEGTESFRVQIFNPSSPFVAPSNANTIEVTLVDDDAITKSFQQGFNGYTGTQDTALYSWDPALLGFADTDAIVDQTYRNNFVGAQDRPSQALLRFDDIFGAGLNQVTAGAQIYGGFVRLFVSNQATDTAEIRFHRMLKDWDNNASWTNPMGGKGTDILNGVTPDDVEAAAIPDALVPTPGQADFVDIPVDLDTLQAWSNGTLANYGWMINQDGENEWIFTTADEFINPATRPQLFVSYENPAGLGTFRLGEEQLIVNETGSVQIPILRVGGTGAATISYTISGDGSDFSGPITGTVPFAANEISRYLTIPINPDTIREANEQFIVTISGVPSIDRNQMNLIVRDNDYNPLDAAQRILYSEIYLNSPGQDAPHEFVEFVGAANVGMGGLFFAGIEGDNGPNIGMSDVVFNLSLAKNGANGHTVITPNVPDFTVDPQATKLTSFYLDPANTSKNQVLQDNSGSYVLIYSPSATLFNGDFDYDWNNDGILELPAGASMVDGFGVLDGGSGDLIYLNNNATTPTTLAISVANGTSATGGPDVIARLQGNTDPFLPTSFFNGNVINNGDDPYQLEAAESKFLPSPGTAATPGYINTGTPAQSPLVSLVSVGTTFGPAQRSRVTGLVLNYDGIVSNVLGLGFASGAVNPASLRLQFQSGGAVPGVSLSVTNLYTNSITVNFSGPGLENGSLPDGKYRILFNEESILGNGRATDNDRDMIVDAAGSDGTFDFHRLFGDSDGNGTVDSNDFADFGSIFGATTGAPSFLPAFDYDNNGTVDSIDLAQFGGRFGITI